MQQMLLRFVSFVYILYDLLKIISIHEVKSGLSPDQCSNVSLCLSECLVWTI